MSETNAEKLQRIEELKQEQARIAAEEAAEMDRLAAEQRKQKERMESEKLVSQKHDTEDVNETVDRMRKLEEIKKKQAELISAELEELELLAEGQRAGVSFIKATGAIDVDPIEIERLRALEKSTLKQAQLLNEESDEMEHIAKSARASTTFVAASNADKIEDEKAARLAEFQKKQEQLFAEEAAEMDRLAALQREKIQNK